MAARESAASTKHVALHATKRSTTSELIESFNRIIDTADDLGAGAVLVALREAAGISIEEVQDRTKIARRHLDALEKDQLQTLPARVFVKGFLKSYLTYLGVPRWKWF